jgi:AbrB family looped-hinge helix DNA binding protein
MREHLTRVSREGQITVPIEVRRALGLQEGDNVAMLLDDDGRVTLERRPSVVARTAGIFRSGRPPMSPEQQEAFERGVAEDQTSLVWSPEVEG